MQNDFIHKNGSLCVENGDKAANNIANFLKENDVDKIFVSMDYHPKNNIASTEFWYDSENKHVEPFTEITLNDVLSKKVRAHYYKAYLIAYLKELEKKDKKLIAWPTHCVENTWGCEICDEIKNVLEDKDNVEYIKKGTNPYTEHYSIFKAEVPLAGYSKIDGCIYVPYILETTNIPLIGNILSKDVNMNFYAPVEFKNETNNTTLNIKLLDKLNTYDKVYICGVATDFCVKESIKDIVQNKPDICKKMVILKDCMASIGDVDFESDDVYAKAIELGTEIK